MRVQEKGDALSSGPAGADGAADVAQGGRFLVCSLQCHFILPFWDPLPNFPLTWLKFFIP